MIKRQLPALVLLALLAGCGATPKGQDEFRAANELAQAQKYQQAIAYLRQAVSKEPKNKSYKTRLAELSQQYINLNLNQADNLLAAPVTNQALEQAQSLLNALLDADLKDSRIGDTQQRLSETRQRLYADLSTDYLSAKDQMDNQNWKQAYLTLSDIEARYANYEDVQKRMATVRTTANKSYLKAANQAMKQDDFVSARTYLEDLLVIMPNNGIAKALLSKVAKNDTPEYFLTKAQTAFDQQQWEQALTLCERVLATDSVNADCLMISKNAKSALAESESNALLAAMNQGKLLVAKGHFLRLQTLASLPEARLTQLRNALSEQMDYSASRHLANSQYALTWVLLSAISDINPAYPSLFSKLREVEDAIMDRSRRSIAVFDFNSPKGNQDAGVIVANNLISRLFNNASNDISILERENLKSILEEMKLGQIGVVSESTAKEMGRVYGIDYAIMGSVLLYKVDENTATSTKSIRYQIGERIEDNIDYLNWIAANPKPTKKELKRAPKAKIMVPEYGEKEYEVTDTKKVGFIQLSFRIVDVLTGENTRVDTIERKIEIADSSNAGVKDAGVEFDPMQVPTDTEIMQQLTEQIVESMAQEVLRPLQQLETYYFNQGADREKRAELAAAVEQYTYAIFNEKLKSVSSSPITQEAQKRVADILDGYVFEK